MNRGHILFAIAWIGIVGVLPLPGMAVEPPVDTEKITKEARETIEATKQYTAQQKEAFQRKAHEELAAVQKQIIALRGKASEASAATRAELQKSISELEKKKDAAKNKLDELRATTDAKWNDVKAGMNSALDDLKNSYQKALSYLP
jgi:chromosome segregation ATPase